MPAGHHAVIIALHCMQGDGSQVGGSAGLSLGLPEASKTGVQAIVWCLEGGIAVHLGQGEGLSRARLLGMEGCLQQLQQMAAQRPGHCPGLRRCC